MLKCYTSAVRLITHPLYFNLFTLSSREYAAAEFPKLCFKATHKLMFYNLIPITVSLICQSLLLLDTQFHTQFHTFPFRKRNKQAQPYSFIKKLKYATKYKRYKWRITTNMSFVNVHKNKTGNRIVHYVFLLLNPGNISHTSSSHNTAIHCIHICPSPCQAVAEDITSKCKRSETKKV